MSIIKRVIKKYAQGKYNQDTIRDFSSWLVDEGHKELKDEALHEIWNEATVEPNDSTVASFYRFQKNNMLNKKSRPKKFFHLRLVKIASIILLPIISAAITYHYVESSTNSNSSEVEMIEYFAANGEVKNFILPDSSTVKLNSGSLLIFPKEFSSQERTVYLEGEAFFDVTPDKNSLFKVKTSDMDIEVLGTAFNVSSYQRNRLVTTTLKRGKVKVYVKEGQDNFILKPGEQIKYDRQEQQAQLNSAAVQDALAWLNGDLVVSKASIEELTRIIERKYGVNVYLSSTKFKNEKITMNLVNNENLAQCMDILSQVIQDLEYNVEDNNVFIY